MSTNTHIAAALINSMFRRGAKQPDDIERLVAETNYRTMLHTVAADAHTLAAQMHTAVEHGAHSQMWELRMDAKAQTVSAYDATIKSFQAGQDDVPAWAAELATENMAALFQANGGEYCMHASAADRHHACAKLHAAFALSAGRLA